MFEDQYFLNVFALCSYDEAEQAGLKPGAHPLNCGRPRSRDRPALTLPQDCLPPAWQ